MALCCTCRCASLIAWFLSLRTLLHGGDASTTLPHQRSTTPRVSTRGGLRQERQATDRCRLRVTGAERHRYDADTAHSPDARSAAARASTSLAASTSSS